jgi:5,10-methylenetetrahydromethanopterin reductase
MGTPDTEAAALAEMRTLWKQEGRDAAKLYSTLNGGGCVLKPGESLDSPRVLAQAGPCAAIGFHSLVELESFGGDWNKDFPFQKELADYLKVYKAYQPEDERHLFNHRGHLMFVRPDETHVTGAVVASMSLTGLPEQLVERVRTMKQAGYDQLALSLPPGQEDDMMEQWIKVLEKV